MSLRLAVMRRKSGKKGRRMLAYAKWRTRKKSILARPPLPQRSDVPGDINLDPAAEGQKGQTTRAGRPQEALLSHTIQTIQYPHQKVSYYRYIMYGTCSKCQDILRGIYFKYHNFQM